VPCFCELYPGICLTTEEKAHKRLSLGSRRVPVGAMNTEYTEQNVRNSKSTWTKYVCPIEIRYKWIVGCDRTKWECSMSQNGAHSSKIFELTYSRNAPIRINWDDSPSEYAENPYDWGFI
jgi:hypothetical protein